MTNKPTPQKSTPQDSLEATWRQWQKQKDNESFRRVMQATDPVINSAITSYAPNSSPAVRSKAKVLTKRALETYDPSRGAKLKTHIMTQLQPLRREARSYNTIHVPERVRMDLGALNEAHNKFVDEHGREPSEGELADYTGLSKKRIAHIRKYDKSQTFETRLQGSDSQENVSMPTVVDEADMWEDYVYQSLSGRDQLIYDLRTGKQGSQRPLGVSEIAKKLKMSPSAVSQRLSKISEEIQRGPEE